MGDWIRTLIEQGGYWGVAFLMLLETVFPPIPSEVIMPLAGLQATQGRLSAPLLVAAGTAGAMAGNIFWFAIARALGVRRFKPLVDRFGRVFTLDWPEVERATEWFRHYEGPFCFIGRMIPTIRSIVSIPAGFAQMPLVPFLVWSTLGTALWTAALTYAGVLLGSQYAVVEDYVSPVSTAVIVAVVLFYLYRVFTWRPHNKR